MFWGGLENYTLNFGLVPTTCSLKHMLLSNLRLSELGYLYFGVFYCSLLPIY